MNDNPWHVGSMARLQRDRIQDEMSQIRLEEGALRAQAREPGFLARLWLGPKRWLVKLEERPSLVRRYKVLTAAHAKHGSRM
jgi:hypothetical protein